MKTLVRQIGPLIAGTSPVFEAVPGFPDIDQSLLSAFRSAVDELSSFDVDVRAVRYLPAPDRFAAARAIVAKYGNHPAVRDAVALRLLRLLHDTASQDADDWTVQLDYIRGLPAHLARHPLVLEYRALALAKKADVPAAAAALEQLIATHGGTSERYGLLGGRYKQLMRAATTPKERRRYLNKAIESYENGMLLDLNNYYPTSNLPRLYRERGSEEDLIRAGEAAVITTEACRRAVILELDDEWMKSTLLGMAFYRGDVADAQSLMLRVEEEGPGVWQLQATLGDLSADIEQHADPEIQAALTAVLDDLKRLLAPPPVERPSDRY